MDTMRWKEQKKYACTKGNDPEFSGYVGMWIPLGFSYVSCGYRMGMETEIQSSRQPHNTTFLTLNDTLVSNERSV